MAIIYRIDRVEAHVALGPPFGRRLVVAALGLANTSGWSHPRLSPLVYVTPPADGVWDFHFQADPPHGDIVLPVLTPLSAAWTGPLPPWCRGVRVHAASNQIAASLGAALEAALYEPPTQAKAAENGGQASFHKTLVAYDDSIQPTGTIHCDGPIPRVEMKKLHHRLVLAVDGPDHGKIEASVHKAAAAGAIASIAASIASGGLALQAALSAALAATTDGLGDAYAARIDDHSRWIYWDA